MTSYQYHFSAIGQHQQQAGANYYPTSGSNTRSSQISRQTAMTVKERSSKKSGGGKSVYRHIPHSQKPPQVVERRNARERRRVQAVNTAFLRLRKHVPSHTKQKRLSKVKTLRVAIDYIKQLQDMIMDHDHSPSGFQGKIPSADTIGQENVIPKLRNVHENHVMVQRKQQFQWEMPKNPPQVNFHSAHTSDDDDTVVSLPEYGSLGMHEITSLPDT
ncbi:achaete-scute homolog 1-like [Ylistrum balloti]|uniref:achaete-scute homolog 1-like n=1 Tax=Ylistrum balloti TaxID=509963 RepID=UPI002905DADB|nr:achaete-scute homolog 1-like [Ylistrum balloti]